MVLALWFDAVGVMVGNAAVSVGLPDALHQPQRYLPSTLERAHTKAAVAANVRLKGRHHRTWPAWCRRPVQLAEQPAFHPCSGYICGAMLLLQSPLRLLLQ